MKLLALEKAGDAFVGIVEDGANYREFWTTKSGVVMGHQYSKEHYGDHRRFAAIYGKFDPWPLFASEPPEIKDLEYSTLESLAATMPTRERRDSSDLLRPDLSDEEYDKYIWELEKKNREFDALPQEERDRIHAEGWDPGDPNEPQEEGRA